MCGSLQSEFSCGVLSGAALSLTPSLALFISACLCSVCCHVQAFHTPVSLLPPHCIPSDKSQRCMRGYDQILSTKQCSLSIIPSMCKHASPLVSGLHIFDL